MKKIEEVYILKPDGTCLTVFNENLPIKGKHKIRRAGTITPTRDGRYSVTVTHPFLAFKKKLTETFETRAAALAAEREYVNYYLSHLQWTINPVKCGIKESTNV